jgi:hypothetical protein
LERPDDELKESVIGVEVFGRTPDYSPKSDPIVRTEIRRLRNRLSEYYQNEGSADTVRFEVPKGGYVPTVRAQDIPTVSLLVDAPVSLLRRRKWLWVSLCACLTCVLGMVGLRPTRSSHLTNINSPAYDLYLRARSLEALPNLAGIESGIDLPSSARNFKNARQT